MNTKQALALATKGYTDAEWKAGGQQEWEKVEAALIAVGLCSSCACHGHRARLGVYEPPTLETYGGRTCWDCEEFTVCGPQQTGLELVPDYGGVETSFGIVSDADPGL